MSNLDYEVNFLKEDLKEKEVRKGRISKRAIKPKEGNILEQDTEAIVNSIGQNVANGFNGMLGKAFVKKFGQPMVTDAISQAKLRNNNGVLNDGQFVSHIMF